LVPYLLQWYFPSVQLMTKTARKSAADADADAIVGKVRGSNPDNPERPRQPLASRSGGKEAHSWSR